MRLLIKEFSNDAVASCSFDLTEDLMYLGRGEKHPGFIPLPNCAGSYISKVHCSICRENGEYWICSGPPGGPPAKNGIYLQGEEIRKPHRLKIGQIFDLFLPPPCSIQLHIIEGVDPEDTLPQRLRSARELSESDITEITLAVQELRTKSVENARLNLALEQKLMDLEDEEKTISKAFREFQARAQESLEKLQEQFEDEQKKQANSAKKLAKTISFLALILAVFGIINFAVSADERSNYGQVVVEILLLSLGGGGALASSKQD